MLGPNERGIVLTPRFEPHNDPYNTYREARRPSIDHLRAESLELDRQSLIYALTFWDRIAWPVPVLPFTGISLGRVGPLEDTLIKERRLICIPKPIFGYVQSMTFSSELNSIGPQNRAIVDAFRGTFFSLASRDKGKWLLASQTTTLLDAVSRRPLSGTAVTLINAIPIVTEVEDPDRFLSWLEHTRDARRRFFWMMMQIAADLENEGGPEGYIAARIREIEDACRELLAVTEQSGLPYKTAWLEFDVNLSLSRFCKGAMAGDWGAGVLDIGIPRWTAALLGGVGACLKIGPGRALHKDHPANSPFASLVKLQYTP
jgi:hypothetical protein